MTCVSDFGRGVEEGTRTAQSRTIESRTELGTELGQALAGHKFAARSGGSGSSGSGEGGSGNSLRAIQGAIAKSERRVRRAQPEHSCLSSTGNLCEV